MVRVAWSEGKTAAEPLRAGTGTTTGLWDRTALKRNSKPGSSAVVSHHWIQLTEGPVLRLSKGLKRLKETHIRDRIPLKVRKSTPLNAFFEGEGGRSRCKHQALPPNPNDIEKAATFWSLRTTNGNAEWGIGEDGELTMAKRQTLGL